LQAHNLKYFFAFLALVVLTKPVLGQPGGPPPAVVKTAEAVAISMAPTRAVAAYAKAKFITTIKAESSGRVIEIATIGQVVKQGEALGLIADEEYALRLNELKNAISSQQAQVDFLKSESVRLNSLDSKNLTSKTALDKNKADLKTAKADLAQAKSRLDQLSNNIKKLTPKAPFNAFVTEQLAQPGQFVNSGQDFLTIMSSDAIEIVAHLPFKLKSVVQIGRQWQYLDQSGDTYQAEVERFIPAATSNSRQMQVHLKDLSESLLPGEPVQLLVPESLPKMVTAVPRDALVLRRQGAYIFIIKDAVAHKIDVTTGIAQGAMIAVEGDIKPQDQVVVRGNERLRDKQAVILVTNPPES
jgi:RND family efflux transporter MFP subunit